jgi:hypothetical protein
MDASRELAPGENPAGVSYQSERGEVADVVHEEYTLHPPKPFDRSMATR